MPSRISRFIAALTAATVLIAPAGAQTNRHRAILVSFDGFSEQPMRDFSDSTTSPTLWSMFRTGACAERVRPAFPSVTPTGHASIWTGAYANVNGVAAIANPKLPLDQSSILDVGDGYSAQSLRAEPIWITAARQGKSVFSHMPTQSPAAPGYPDVSSTRPAADGKRARAETTLARPQSVVLNVYNEQIAEARVITAVDGARDAREWKGLDHLGPTRTAPREFSWAFGSEGDSLHALVYAQQNGAGAAILSTSRDVATGVVAHLAPVDTAPPHGRALARHFSEPLRVNLSRGRRTFVYARLFDLAPDLSRVMLFVSEARVMQANRPEIAAAYDDAVRGVPGNGADHVKDRGGFGPMFADGGDGTAELRYFETVELVVRQFMRGTDWGWRKYSPDMLIDYLPYPDEALHNWYGYAHPSTPGVSPAVRARASALLARAYSFVDLRLAQYERLAAESPATMLFVTGEHGMRPAWKSFKPNILLEAAGLLSADSAGRIDLAHTLVAATRGNWIAVNRSTRRDGIVSSDSADAVLWRAEEVLRGARDSSGAPIVTEIWRAASAAGDSLGLRPPGGGDLYYGLAPGFYPNAGATGSAVTPLPRPRGEHGFPSTDRDMQPALCALGAGITAHRYGAVRSIDIAPTVSAWLGIGAPADAQGVSLLGEILKPRQ